MIMAWHWHLLKYPVDVNRLPGASRSPYTRRDVIGHLARRLARELHAYQGGIVTLSFRDAPTIDTRDPPQQPTRFEAAIPHLAALMTMTFSHADDTPTSRQISVAFNQVLDGAYVADTLPPKGPLPLTRPFCVRDFDEAWLLVCQLGRLLKVVWIEPGDEGHPL